jgi:hypothetical protein
MCRCLSASSDAAASIVFFWNRTQAAPLWTPYKIVQASSAATAHSVRSDFRLRQSFVAMRSSMSDHLYVLRRKRRRNGSDTGPQRQHEEAGRLMPRSGAV